MTKNQIEYAKLVETNRNNLATERENYRSNIARETETNRHNLNDESIRATTNAINDAHNIVSEQIGWGNLAETNRSNLVGEQIGWENAHANTKRATNEFLDIPNKKGNTRANQRNAQTNAEMAPYEEFKDTALGISSIINAVVNAGSTIGQFITTGGSKAGKEAANAITGLIRKGGK